jgi:serine/threonine protein kinase
MTSGERRSGDLLGSLLGNYRILERIGEGGMGIVYLGRHEALGHRVAVKVLQHDMSRRAEIVRRFFNEAQAASAIRSPGIVQVFDFGTTADGRAYFVMELLEGQSLTERLLQRQLDEAECCRLGRQVANVLQAAHAAGITHRDLKPDNLFLVPDPEVMGGERVKVLDFGIAKMLDRDGSLDDDGNATVVKTQIGMMLGTPQYMSPEQCRGAGAVDTRSDIYSLGCILFEMVCGRPPFVGEGAGEVVGAHQYVEPPTPRSFAPGISDRLASLIVQMLAKRPEARPQTMSAVGQALEEILRGLEGAPPWVPASGQMRMPESAQMRMPESAQMRMPEGAPRYRPESTPPHMPESAQMRIPESASRYRPESTPPHMPESAQMRIPESAPRAFASPPTPQLQYPVVNRALVSTTIGGSAGESHERAPTPARRSFGVPIAIGGLVAGALVIGIVAMTRSSGDPGAAEETDGRKLEVECLHDQYNQEWAELATCADRLSELNADLAKDLKARAALELEAVPHLGAFEAALRDKNLKQAKAELDALANVTRFSKLKRSYEEAEDTAIQDLTARLAAARSDDCQAHQQLVEQARADSPPRVTDEAVRLAPCTPTAAEQPAQAETQPAQAETQAAQPTQPQSQPAPQQAKSSPTSCNNEALATKGQQLYSVGMFAAALATYEVAWACKQDPDYAVKAFILACHVPNVAKAKLFWRRVSPSRRSQAIGICLRNGITEAQLTAP